MYYKLQHIWKIIIIFIKKMIVVEYAMFHHGFAGSNIIFNISSSKNGKKSKIC